MRSFLWLLFFSVLLSGCAAPPSRWRDDAFNRFNSAVTAGSQQFAPEETDNIRDTLALADRYFNKQMLEDADRLYQLSCQKSQLLYRNLVLSKVRQGSSLTVETEKGSQPEVVAIDRDPVSISEVVRQEESPDRTALLEQAIDIPIPGSSSSDAVLDKKEPVRSKKRPEPTRIRQKSPEIQPTAEPGRTTIYLTFDDGPSRLTLPIANFLKSQGVLATFFVLGNNLRGYEKSVSATVAMGHRVGNHTLSHDLRKLDASFQQEKSEVLKTAAMIEKLGGDGRMVRIPYGASTKSMISKVSADGGQIFDWDINSNDSTKRGAKDHAFIEQSVINQLKRSGKRHIILLFHDGAGHEATLTAIRNLVPRLKQEGYRFGVLSRNDRVASADRKGQPANE